MQTKITSNNFILILGTAQDGGYPHIGCYKNCCLEVEKKPELKRMVASIAIIDKIKSKVWLIDVSPDINSQLSLINAHINNFNFPYLSGIFLTHAHTGHYSGLLNLGLEGLNINKVPVYVMPKMKNFLIENNMFSQLINNNIILKEIENNLFINLNDEIKIAPFLVPHRNELSETVGYRIITENKSVIYVPDIDSWNQLDINPVDLANSNDLLLIDGTFFTKEEVKYRNINKIPHPSISESMKIFDSSENKNKIYFTHLNHTNKALDKDSEEYANIITSGYNILNDKQIFNL